MIIVTGANGRLGRETVERLLERVPAEQVGVSVRDPEQAKDLAERGVRVRRGDFTDAASLADSFEGATQVLLVSIDRLGEESRRDHRRAITAAARAGAHRVLYTSHQAASPASAFAPAPDHADAEDALAASGIAFTSLRNGFYADTAVFLAAGARETGELVAPQDGPVSWTSRSDLAAAAAAVLADEGRFDGPTPPLTGPEAIDLAALAERASEVFGRRVTRVTVSDDDYVAGLAAHGVPEDRARLFLGLFQAARAGEFDVVDPAMAGLLGRPATPVQDVLAG
jgi:NAD(P)H dehydrogenase (quinone)